MSVETETRQVKNADDFWLWLKYNVFDKMDAWAEEKRFWKYSPPESQTKIQGKQYIIHNKMVGGRKRERKTR